MLLLIADELGGHIASPHGTMHVLSTKNVGV